MENLMSLSGMVHPDVAEKLLTVTGKRTETLPRPIRLISTTGLSA